MDKDGDKINQSRYSHDLRDSLQCIRMISCWLHFCLRVCWAMTFFQALTDAQDHTDATVLALGNLGSLLDVKF